LRERRGRREEGGINRRGEVDKITKNKRASYAGRHSANTNNIKDKEDHRKTKRTTRKKDRQQEEKEKSTK
jgi:hypothetical protein